jgi:hemerythrin-like domain-containing protein
MMAEISARMDANTKEMNAKMDANQAEMRSTVCAFRSELKETIQHEMKAVIQPIQAELDETTACNEATETEPDPGKMQSIEEYQEIPKVEAAVMLVGELRKRRMVWNLAAEHRQRFKERTR